MPDLASPLDLQIDVAAWRRIPRLHAQLNKAAHATIAHLPAKLRVPLRATVLLTGNAKIRKLNRDFRGMDKPTNVLSFPQFSPSELPKLGKQKGGIELGDIALGYQYIASEAKTEHKLLINHVTHLVIHGLLHLFGYDHMDEGEAAQMERLETRIMKALGLPDPYGLPPASKTAAKRRQRK